MKKDFNDDFILEIEIIKRARDESPLNKIHVALRVLQLLSFMAMTSMVVFIPDCSAMNILDTYAFLFTVGCNYFLAQVLFADMIDRNQL
ncbi:uncharacterized protein H6S33_008917 [Morchella sextelata]|uniref:uncharacterized protein n=1 Tax=Morchella sextelata TaxID=1174677 RepID=UPI001D039228|nr:uncharacterized protein H6S33_008917 [Morchella sextelata]KAH0612537.1 hypothetical protein H6S33_008917 [Morchella sextelata]